MVLAVLGFNLLKYIEKIPNSILSCLAGQTNSVERKVSSASSDSGLGQEVAETEAELGPEETADKRVITPDDVAVRQLLNFDEVRSDQWVVSCKTTG